MFCICMMFPSEDGFRMPGEFEKHSGTWMIFPHRPDNWRDDALAAQEQLCALANLVGKYEKVTMLVPRRYVRSALGLVSTDVSIIVKDTDDAWMRDTGAVFVVNGKEVRGVSFDFNAWGGDIDGLYQPWDLDAEVGKYMCKARGFKMYTTPGFVLEGGSVHVDGEGTLITTEECLLSAGRNPHLTRDEIETNLKMYLGVEKIVWLPYGIVDDETNGHVDNMCCFARPGEVMLAWTDDKKHPQYERSKAAYEVLKTTLDAKGRKFVIHKIHIPKDMYITQIEADGVVQGHTPRTAGDRLASSYINFIMPNGAIIYPTFGDDEYDSLAHKKFEEIFPEREIIGFYSREFLLGGGNMHCLTQQQPGV